MSAKNSLETYLQNIQIGKYIELGDPFISVDIPFSIIHENIIHLRPEQSNFPSTNEILEYVNKQESQQILIITTNVDWSFPRNMNDLSLLSNKNIRKIITHNPYIIHEKIFPLPLGPKWQFSSRLPYGETKQLQKNIYLKNCASNALDAYKRFNNKRVLKIYLRPMAMSVKNTQNYNRQFSNAVSVNREFICNKINKLKCVDDFSKHRVSAEEYLINLNKYRFVISPHGNGLDSHTTWEALMCGCIPIVPSSPLNPIYKLLPVWVVNDWSEITEETAKKKEEEFLKNINSSNFNLAFSSGLKEYIISMCSQSTS